MTVQEDVIDVAVAALQNSVISDALIAGNLVVTSGGTYDPITDTETGAAETLHSCIMAKVGVRTEIEEGTEIQPNDEDFVIVNLNTVPSSNNIFRRGSQDYAIVFIKNISADVGNAYEAVLRRKA